MRLKSLSRTGSASAANPWDKLSASRVERDASVTGEQQSDVRVILIAINITENINIKHKTENNYNKQYGGRCVTSSVGAQCF